MNKNYCYYNKEGCSWEHCREITESNKKDPRFKEGVCGGYNLDIYEAVSMGREILLKQIGSKPNKYKYYSYGRFVGTVTEKQ